MLKKIEAFLGELSLEGKTENILRFDFIKTPLGEMLAIVDEEKLHLLEFCNLATLETRLRKLQSHTKARIIFGRNHLLESVEAELSAYFSGQNAQFSVDCAFHGSDFECRTWKILTEIPAATTYSYAQQAKILGQPTAYRAVARANSQNKIAIIIPCHRVVGADGHLTGYAGGIERKQWLLAHEKQYFS